MASCVICELWDGRRFLNLVARAERLQFLRFKLVSFIIVRTKLAEFLKSFETSILIQIIVLYSDEPFFESLFLEKGFEFQADGSGSAVKKNLQIIIDSLFEYYKQRLN